MENKTLKISEKLDLPTDILRNVTKFEVIHSDTIYVENHFGILQFTDTEIHINCKKHTVKIFGENLEIKSFTKSHINIFGLFFNIEFGDFR